MDEKIVKDSQGLAKELVNDRISRQAAVAGFYEMASDMDYLCTVSDYVSFLESLPSAQPERKRGKWVYAEDEYGIDGYHCNQCGFFVPWDYAHKFINYIEDYNFCPNCGAKMDEELGL